MARNQTLKKLNICVLGVLNLVRMSVLEVKKKIDCHWQCSKRERKSFNFLLQICMSAYWWH